jgi:hypothetical protein
MNNDLFHVLWDLVEAIDIFRETLNDSSSPIDQKASALRDELIQATGTDLDTGECVIIPPEAWTINGPHKN